MHHLFIEFTAANDRTDRTRLYINLVRITVKNTQYQIRIQSTLFEPLLIKNGVHQGDALACLLFNIRLEKVIRDAKINTRGSIFFKSVQIFAYADDIDIVG
jgi:sorting nexin-29